MVNRKKSKPYPHDLWTFKRQVKATGAHGYILRVIGLEPKGDS